MKINEIICGDCIEVLKTMPDYIGIDISEEYCKLAERRLCKT